MKREDIFNRIFELEFCEPREKADKERQLTEMFKIACEQTKLPLYVLKPAILKTYPQYRAKRLGKEMPELPFHIRGQ